MSQADLADLTDKLREAITTHAVEFKRLHNRIHTEIGKNNRLTTKIDGSRLAGSFIGATTGLSGRLFECARTVRCSHR